MIVKEINGMQGLFASKEYKLNEIICKIEGEIIGNPTRTSIQVTEEIHIDVKAPLAFINHSCFPNITIENYLIKAIRPIQIGDQICFNYNHNENVLANSFECVDCGQWIKGKYFLKDFPCLKENNNRVEINNYNKNFATN